MDVFEMLAGGRLDDLAGALATDPSLARTRHSSGASLLAWAYYTGHRDAADLIRPHVDPQDPYDAIISGNSPAVEAALGRGWDGNMPAPDGFTPLGLAAYFDRPTTFALLLQVTRDVNARSHNGQQVAALHAAATVRGTGMVETLLRAGADPNLKQAGGFVALHTAAQHGDGAIAGLLLLFGGDPRIKNDAGETPIELAQRNAHDWLAERLEAWA